MALSSKVYISNVGFRESVEQVTGEVLKTQHPVGKKNTGNFLRHLQSKESPPCALLTGKSWSAVCYSFKAMTLQRRWAGTREMVTTSLDLAHRKVAHSQCISR